MKIKYFWFNNGEDEGKYPEGSEPIGWIRGRSKLLREKVSSTKNEKKHPPWNKNKKGLQKAWNAGLKNPYEEDTLSKMSESAKIRVERDGLPKTAWKKGQDAWNKGDFSTVSKRIEDKESHRNVWYCCVRYLTSISWKLFERNINPDMLKRGKTGEDDSYQLDHKESIYTAYSNKRNPIEVSHQRNLQMIHWVENRKKTYLTDFSCENLHCETLQKVFEKWCKRHEIDEKWLTNHYNFEMVKKKKGML